MNEEKVKKLTVLLTEVEKKISLLQQKNTIQSAMLERLLRPLFIGFLEKNPDFSAPSISLFIQQALHEWSVQNDFPNDLKSAIQSRYATESGKQIDWIREVAYTTSAYNHPLVMMVNYIFKHLSPEGQAVVARYSMQNLS